MRAYCAFAPLARRGCGARTRLRPLTITRALLAHPFTGSVSTNERTQTNTARPPPPPPGLATQSTVGSTATGRPRRVRGGRQRSPSSRDGAIARASALTAAQCDRAHTLSGTEARPGASRARCWWWGRREGQACERRAPAGASARVPYAGPSLSSTAGCTPSHRARPPAHASRAVIDDSRVGFCPPRSPDASCQVLSQGRRGARGPPPPPASRPGPSTSPRAPGSVP